MKHYRITRVPTGYVIFEENAPPMYRYSEDAVRVYLQECSLSENEVQEILDNALDARHYT